ncbi:MAG: hypothetical protein ACO3ZY_01510 [Phycisphaerales bacterium]
MAKPRAEGVTDLMERAEAASRRRAWFEAERLAGKALAIARAADDFDAMARILLPLQEARRQRLAEAFETKKVRVLAEAPNEQTQVSPGIHLVEPPLGGADARRFRLLALEQEVPVAVVCREPITRLNECPIVAIGPVTIRTRIAPPKKPSAPTPSWMAKALEQLGDSVLENLDPGIDLLKRIDHLLNCLETHPDHEKMHQALAEFCREAARLGLRTPPPATPAGYAEEA